MCPRAEPCRRWAHPLVLASDYVKPISDAADVTVVGGNSAVGVCLRALLPNANFIVRAASTAGDVVVADYRDIPAIAFRRGGSVIIVTGVVNASPPELKRVNVDLARQIAARAAESGSSRIVHLSSFSVYGRASQISSETAEAPTSHYGLSKLEAEHAIATYQSAGIDVISARFPAIVGTRKDKLAQLVALWSRLGMVPIPRTDVRRSMITTETCALTLAALAEHGGPQLVLAADAMPFSYGFVSEQSRRLKTIKIDAAVLRLLSTVAPGVSASLWQDSFLAAHDNYCVSNDFPSLLGQHVKRLLELHDV